MKDNKTRETQQKKLLMNNLHLTRETQQIKLLEYRLRKLTEIIKNKKLSINFEPSMKTISRILKTLKENGPGAKTALSLSANLNYARLAKHIIWLEKKGFVKSTIRNNIINFDLSEKGRIFTSMVLE
jgi:predicted transcriptional regulator